MGILNYISEKKKQFSEAQNIRQTKQQEKQRLEIEQLKAERGKLEERNKTVRQLQAEKTAIKELKRENFASSPLGGALKNLSQAAKESKARGTAKGFGFGGSGFNTGATTNKKADKNVNVFGGSFGKAQDAPRIKKTKRDKNITIIVKR